MAKWRLGLSTSPEEWNKEDDDECDWFLRRLQRSRGSHGRLEDWRLLDQYVPIVVGLRIDAKEAVRQSEADYAAGKRKKPLHIRAAWKTIRKRAFQRTEEVIDGPIRISNHHDRRIRAAYAEAFEVHPDDYKARRELAHDILMEHGDSRTQNAWEAKHYPQESLFEPVATEAAPYTGADRVTYKYEIIPDENPYVRHPGERSFLDHVLDEAPITLRQRAVAKLLSEDDSYEVVAKTLGVSKGTVANDVNVLREHHQHWMDGWGESEDDLGDDSDEHTGHGC